MDIAVKFKSSTLFQSPTSLVELLDPAHVVVSRIQLMYRIPLEHLPQQEVIELVARHQLVYLPIQI
jgi:hypothetical protein